MAFSTDEELCEALGFVSDGVLKVYVRINGKIQKYILQTRQDMISWKQKQTNKRKAIMLIIKENYILINQARGNKKIMLNSANIYEQEK